MTHLHLLRGWVGSLASVGVLVGVIGWQSANAENDPRAGLCATRTTDQLLYGVVQGDVAQVKRVLQHADLNIDERDSLGVTALFAAITGPRETSGDVLMMLIRAGADVNATDPTGATPLMYAVAVNNDEAVRILLSHGADVNACDDAGRTVKDCADAVDASPVVELLGAPVTSPPSSD